MICSLSTWALKTYVTWHNINLLSARVNYVAIPSLWRQIFTSRSSRFHKSSCKHRQCNRAILFWWARCTCVNQFQPNTLLPIPGYLADAFGRKAVCTSIISIITFISLVSIYYIWQMAKSLCLLFSPQSCALATLLVRGFLVFFSIITDHTSP